MDRMTDWEVSNIIEHLPYTDRLFWEQCRQQMYINVQLNSKKRIQPKDILHFVWDDEQKQSNHTSITQKEIDRLRKRAMEIQNNISNS